MKNLSCTKVLVEKGSYECLNILHTEKKKRLFSQKASKIVLLLHHENPLLGLLFFYSSFASEKK